MRALPTQGKPETLSQSTVRNRLLATLKPDDYASLEPLLKRVSLPFGSVLVEAHKPITQVLFPESGVISVIADAAEGRIEISLIGREGFTGIPVALGASQIPCNFLVQAEGEALRIAPGDLRAAIAARPSIFRVLGLYTQFMIVQIAQTAHVNATFGVEARLARWLLMTHDRVEGDEMSFTHDFLSAMLGVRRPGVTTATHVLEGTGAIRARRGRIEIRDRDKLMELAGESYTVAEREYERLMAEV